jgi:hypothetical protein
MQVTRSEQTCPQCKARVPLGNTFCGACGLPLDASRCPSCGVPVPDGGHYCGACGNALAQTRSPALLSLIAPQTTQPRAARAGRSSRTQVATVGLLAVLAARPLLKLGVLLCLGTFVWLGATSSGWGIAGGFVIALLVLLFVVIPRRQR